MLFFFVGIVRNHRYRNRILATPLLDGDSQLVLEAARAPAVPDLVPDPKVQQPVTSHPACSRRRPSITHPRGHRGSREDTRVADAVAASKRREQPG